MHVAERVEVNGVNLNFALRGPESAESHIVVIGGLGSTIADVEPIAGHLGQRHQVLTFDNLGAGESDRPKGPYSIAQMAECTAGLMHKTGFTDEQTGQRAHVLGISMGVRVALKLALSHADSVDRLVLTSGSPDGCLPRTNRGRLSQFVAFGARPWLNALRSGRWDAYNGLREQLAATRRFDCTAALPNIPNEVLIAHGEEDTLPPIAVAREMREALPRARLKEFRGGHLFFMVDGVREKYLDAVDEFLAPRPAAIGQHGESRTS